MSNTSLDVKTVPRIIHPCSGNADAGDSGLGQGSCAAAIGLSLVAEKIKGALA